MTPKPTDVPGEAPMAWMNLNISNCCTFWAQPTPIDPKIITGSEQRYAGRRPSIKLVSFRLIVIIWPFTEGRICRTQEGAKGRSENINTNSPTAKKRWIVIFRKVSRHTLQILQWYQALSRSGVLMGWRYQRWKLIDYCQDKLMTSGKRHWQGTKPPQETIATISLFFSGENLSYKRSTLPESFSSNGVLSSILDISGQEW